MTKTYTVVNGRPLYCHNTGHPCGTDTRQVDNPCDCGCCEASRRIEELEAALRDTIPVIVNARDDPCCDPWQVETRQAILDRVQAALKGEDG